MSECKQCGVYILSNKGKEIQVSHCNRCAKLLLLNFPNEQEGEFLVMDLEQLLAVLCDE